jgi:hypothetical protein
MDLAVMTGDATFEPSIRAEVQVREDTVSCIETPDMHLGSGW